MCAEEMDIIVDHLGETRKMGLQAPSDDDLKMRASRMAFATYLQSIGKELIPRSQWAPVDRRAVLDTRLITNQRSSSGCTGWSAAQALARLRVLRGMSYQRLSGAYIYAQINGGRDNGSVIVQAMSALEETGTCLEADFDFPNIYTKQFTSAANANAKRFKLLRGLTLDTFDEAVTAVIMGMIVQFPVQVGSSFENFNNGVAGYSSGRGNHSVHADGLAFVAGKWVLDTPNTWGAQWGPFKNGRCYISEPAFAGQGGSDDSYVHIDPAYDPQDPNLPPVPTE